ncbi:MAG: hypothetical protein HF314_18140 [Ignavibacteria bacterium]|nr:hypothetical protein [Ignavibacteria bacterium]MCU7505010.1 hypothetical protein [Ignavibacteria bacterium]MCU7514856.1 hypothetical protein [Ignavibacteria bacterium]
MKALKNALFFCMLAMSNIILSGYALSQQVSLDGRWLFAVDTAGSFTIENLKSQAKWREAIAPMSWQVQFPELRDYQGVAWYSKTFSLPGQAKDGRVIIHFEAVDYKADVFINGRPAGSHEGGYTPFEFDVTGLVKKGSNEVTLRVMDPLTNETGTEGISYWNIPHGKQSWYVQTSGIWQSACIQMKPERSISYVHITPLIDGTVSIEGVLEGNIKQRDAGKVLIKIKDPFRETVLSASALLSEDGRSFHYGGKISNPKLWSFEQPNLYQAEFSLGKSKSSESFGFRKIEARDRKLYLNGKPFYLMAALDQDFYPETMYSVPSEEYIRDEMLKARKMGLNMLRCHIKVPDRRYLKVADEVGLLVWYEIPNWDVFTPEAARRGEETLSLMLKRDWNHPSLVIISLINESWGIDMQKEEQRSWLKQAFGRAKELAAGRLVVDNSACFGNFHVKTDINDYHTYYSIPDNRRQFDETIKSVANRGDWLFSKFDDAEETKNEPLLISEFGNWGLPLLPEKLPWWFSRKFLDVDVSMPEGVHKRFNDYKFWGTFHSYDELAAESQKAQFMALKYEIEQIRLQPELQGYVITEFTDINWESNGLLDMWRNMKYSARNISEIQQQDVIIPRPARYTYWEGEKPEIKIFISHYSSRGLEGARLMWKATGGQRGNIPVNISGEASVSEIPTLRITLDSLRKPEKLTVEFELVDRAGALCARNYTEIFIYPYPDKTGYPEITFYGNSESLKELAGQLNSHGGASQGKLIVTNTLDDSVLNELKGGASVLCLVDTLTKLPDSLKVKVISRKSEWYDGNWASNFNWIRSERKPFKDISFGKFLGLESSNSSPQLVLGGIEPEDFGNVLSGMYVGWLHLNSAYVYQMNLLKGRLVLCTLPVAENFNKDPFSKTLFYSLVRYAADTHQL